MKSLRLACTLLLISAGSAYAASNISGKFDGTYVGTAEPATAMGAPGCMPFSLGELRISRGFLGTGKLPDQPAVAGFITEEGYVAAFMTRPGHMRSPLDGRWEDGSLVLGFIEADTNCVWILRLRARP